MAIKDCLIIRQTKRYTIQYNMTLDTERVMEVLTSLETHRIDSNNPKPRSSLLGTTLFRKRYFPASAGMFMTIHESIIKKTARGTQFLLSEAVIKEGSNRHLEKVKKRSNDGNRVEKVDISHILGDPLVIKTSKFESYHAEGTRSEKSMGTLNAEPPPTFRIPG